MDRATQIATANVRYLACVVPPERSSVALALLALWERPWSSKALRFASHVLQRAYAKGLDVLEAV